MGRVHVQVADMKQKIESSQGAEYPVSQQVVIYQGKVRCSPGASWLPGSARAPDVIGAGGQVLRDETTLEDNNITHENFVVVMITRVGKCY